VRWLLAVAVAVAMMNAAFGVARAQGTWSTAQLSVKRYLLAATSVGNLAMFAGGSTGGVFLHGGWLRICEICAWCIVVVRFAL
jgi:glucokinase